MIGDALTDVAAGRAVGARTVLMLTGVTTRETADALPPDERPTRDRGGRRGPRGASSTSSPARPRPRAPAAAA